MVNMNYMQRVGHSSCIRCNFETDDKMSFQEQDEAMRVHLAENHPDWMTDGGASILKDRLPKEMVTVPKQEYDSLVKDSKFLEALRAAGVDNWDGYEFALDTLDEG